MKKIYIILTFSLMLFVAFGIQAQRTFLVRLSGTGFDIENLTVKLGDTVQIFVVGGDPQRLTTVGTVPTPSATVDTTIGVTRGRSGVYYFPRATGTYNFRTDNPNTPNFTLRVIPDLPIRLDVGLSATGFEDPDNVTVEVGDTVHFLVVSGNPKRIQTVGNVPSPSRVIDTTIAERAAPNGLYYVPKAVGVYTFTTGLSFNLSDDFVVTVVAPPVIAGTNENMLYSGVSFFPNPVKSEMLVNLNPAYGYDLIISNMNGNIFMAQKVSGQNTAAFNVDGLDKGAYILYLTNSKAKNPKSFKFIKE